MKYNKFLIVSTIAIFIGGFYLYFSHDLNKASVVSVAFGSSLVSSNGTAVIPTDSSLGDEVSSDISFLTTLVSLKTLSIDTTLFSNKSFNSLRNNSVKIEPVQAGRINPFAPLDSEIFGDISLITDAPSQITTKSAILNGSVTSLTGVTDTYFEYGLTAQTLNSIAVSNKPSLVGAFIKSVSGLTSKTIYFYRACAKINNTPLCGEVISFTTN